MKSKNLLFISLVCLLTSCKTQNNQLSYDTYKPSLKDNNKAFDFDSNSYSADIKIDGIMDDERWNEEDVLTLGSFDNSDVANETYGAIVNSVDDYENTKRGISKMFRGNVGFHFGFEIHDSDLAYKALNDGDDAIWSDNILLNIDTAIDGAEMPMSDDYYIMVTAFGNTCFRRGANAKGMWGGWQGVIDYQSCIFYDDKNNPTGFGVELILPYSQFGLDKTSPIGIALRSCDRISESNTVLEREWYYLGSRPDFNCPNSYIIWGKDNKMYNYYDYQMPNVSIKGNVVDYITNEPLANVVIGETSTNANGEFILNDVNSNIDLVLSPSSEVILSNQNHIVSKDLMRQANGNVVSTTLKLITNKNKLTKKITGTITGYNNLVNSTITVGENTSNISSDGSYSIDCTFDNPIMTAYIKESSNSFSIKEEIRLDDVLNGKTIYDFILPDASIFPNLFGKGKDTSTYVGWTNNGLYARFESKTKTNGYALAIDTGNIKKIILYHSFGTMCVTDFYKPTWDYYSPSNFEIEADIHTNANNENVFTMIIPYSLLSLDGPKEIKIAPFEYTHEGPFSYYVDSNNNILTFGNDSILKKYPILKENGDLEFSIADTVISSYSFSTFGKGDATALFEYVDGEEKGIRVTINYTKKTNLWGYGIMFGNLTTNTGSTDLYALGYGTMDHKIYGDWLWKGQYQFTSNLNVTSSEDEGKLTMFYPLSTLNGSNYNIGINDSTEEIGIQLFEYVLDSSGELFGCYNCIKVDSQTKRFDTGVENFVIFNLK